MRYQNLNSFRKHLASAAPHHLSRVYLVLIADDFERAKALDAILSYFPPDVSFSRYKGGEVELREVFDALESPLLIGGDPVVILDEAEKIPKKNLQVLAEFIEANTAKAAHFFLIGARAKTPLSSAVEKEGVILDLSEEKPWDKEKRLAEQLIERAKNAGKRLLPDAVNLLFERLDKDAALLEAEIDKLICFVGDRLAIQREDVLTISASSKTATLWQTAEEIVWNGESSSDLLSSTGAFAAAIPALRSQLHLGLVLATLIEEKRPSSEWSAYLPKIWPKTLDKRSQQANELGTLYFRKGLEALFEIEHLSRSGSNQFNALYDRFRMALFASRKRK